MPFPLTFLAEKELACPTYPNRIPGEQPYSYSLSTLCSEKGLEPKHGNDSLNPLITLPKEPSRVISG